MASLKLVTPAAYGAVTRAEAKKHLEVDDTDHDDLIQAFVDAATEHAQSFLGRALVGQTWQLTLDEFPGHCDGYIIRVPLPPLIEIVSIKYDDAAGDEQTLSESDYVVDAQDDDLSRIKPVASSWPATVDRMGAVRVTFIAGYVSTDSPPVGVVPADIRVAILLMIGTLYETRESVVIGKTAVMMPWSAEQLLRRKRIDLSLA